MSVGIAVALAAVGIMVAVIALAQAMRVSRRVSAVPPDGNLYDAIARLDSDLGAVEQAVSRMQPVLQSLHERMPQAIRNSAVITYDATGDMAGHLSRSIALLNERGDGLVVTLLRRRSEVLFFTKMIRGGKGVEELSPEEEAVVKRARGG
jgi:hypothetical protein